ncbi:myeloid-associated differentiation marker homolog [Salminus brasiliensis]|uniref:myeloid-associated differentiation marker homolog n=1 Tax=Salminus brasiliensis TaxID=930266 RepID=UPI003B82F53B
MAYLYWMRLAALVSSCVTFGLVTHAGGLDGEVGAWCMFCWTFSFAGTLLIFLVELFKLTEYIKDPWANFPATFSSYAALLCLFASIIFPHSFLKAHQNYDVHNHLIAATVFSCLATLAYLLEVWMAWVESKCYMATTQGHLLVCQTYVAGVILYFISNPVSYTDQAAVRWCMAVYCICFICSVASIIKIVLCNLEEPRWLKHFNLCAAIMYFSAVVTWPVFKLNSHYPSQIYPPNSCQEGLGLCPRGILVMVTVLTFLNFLLYSFSLCCFCLSVSTTERQQYLVLPSTSALPALCPAQLTTDDQQHSSDPSGRLLGDQRRHPRNYQSLNQHDFLKSEPNVVVCDAGLVSQIYVRE